MNMGYKMNNLIDPLLPKSLQMTKAVFNNNLQTCKSSQIIGRKINNGCLTVKSQKNKKFNMNVQSIKKSDLGRRFITKKSPDRSLSLNRAVGEKEEKTESLLCVSPLRSLKKGKDKQNLSSHLLEEMPKMLKVETACPGTPRIVRQKRLKTNKSSQNLEDNSRVLKTSPYGNLKILAKTGKKKKIEVSLKEAEEKKNFGKKAKSGEKKNKKIGGKKIVIPKIGLDFKMKETKNSDTDENCTKTDRDTKKRKKKGTDLFSTLKLRPKKVNKSQETLKHKKSPDSLQIDHPKKFLKNKKILEILKDDLPKEKAPNTNRLEKTQKKLKFTKTKKTKSMWLDEKSFPVIRRRNLHQSSDEKRELSVENRALKDQLRKLKQRVRQTKKKLLSKDQYPKEFIDQVVKIQRWFRSRIKSKPVSQSKSEKRVGLLSPQMLARSNSDLVQCFDQKIFTSVSSEIKPLKTKTSSNSLHDLSETSENEYLKQQESKPKKVQKVPSLCLGSILQSKKCSNGCISDSHLGKYVIKDSLNSDSEDSEGFYDINSSSSMTKIKQISSLDIERHHFSSSEDLSDSFRSSQEQNYETELLLQNQIFDKNTSQVSDASNSDSVLQPPLHTETLKPTQINPESIEDTSPHPNLFTAIQQISEKSPNEIKEILKSYQKPEEIPQNSPDLLSGDLSYEDSYNSQVSHCSDPELFLKKILENSSELKTETIDRPGHNMIGDSDSSEDLASPAGVVFHTDTSISEEKLESFTVSPRPFLLEFDSELSFLVQTEIDLFVQSIVFSMEHSYIDPGVAFIETYVHKLLEKLQKNEEEMLDLINTPSYQEPCNKLEYLQTTPLGKLHKFPALELILPQDLSNELKVEFDTEQMPNKQIYLQMVFDCVNEALNHIRPFALDGLPDPWTQLSPTLYGEGQIKVVFDKIKKLIRKWESAKCGILPSTAEKIDQKVGKSREERLNLLISQNVQETEEKWLWYEDEETQVKIESAELAFAMLLEETSEILKTVK